jgi:hypothetical protein
LQTIFSNQSQAIISLSWLLNPNTMKEIIQRVLTPTPKFFKTLRNIGLVLAAVSTAIITAPVALPAVVVTVAGYLAVAGAIASAVSQAAVDSEFPKKDGEQ